jgi:peptidoglycan/LPS O-acetylase OafA/YrhL
MSQSSKASSVHLDAARAIAAITVMSGHTRDLFFTSITGKVGHGIPSAAKIGIGPEAVMVFFVLSGYLVGGSAIRLVRSGKWSWKDYLTKRLTRLWVVLIPALVFGVCLDLLGAHLFGGPGSIYSAPAPQTTVPAGVLDRITATNVLGTAAFVQTILVKSPGTNMPLWSLANEFWYYIAFPLGLLALAPGSWKRRILSGLGCVAICCFVGLPILSKFPIWILGALISLLPVRGLSSKWVVAALGLMLFPAFVLVKKSPLPNYGADWVIALIFACFLFAALHRNLPSGDGLYTRGARLLSGMSYTLYVVHLPMAIFLCAAFNRPWHYLGKTPANILLYLGFNGALIGLAWLFHLAFEANTDKVRHLIMAPASLRRAAPASVLSGPPSAE